MSWVAGALQQYQAPGRSWRNGGFAKARLEGTDGNVDLAVPALTRNAQHPVTQPPPGLPDIAVADLK